MKKSYLISSILYLAGGMVLLFVVLLTDSVLDSLLIGFASGAICVGITGICRYFYWKAPENEQRYRERLANETIELHDELKIKLRDRSGRYAYVLGLIVVSISIAVFSILGQLEVISNSRMMVLFMAGYLVFQIAAGSVIYKCLLRKY